MVVATRVVGSDYDTEIPVACDDEVKFERFFEQFRRVFVDVLAEDLRDSAPVKDVRNAAF